MKEDKFGVRTAVLLGAFFILVILLGSFVGRKLVNVVRASIDPTEESTSVLTEEKGVSLPIETESSEQEIVERVYLEEIPLEGQEKLYSIYEQWDLKRKQNTLKDCIFKDEFMRTTFSCETYGGEKYVDVAFRFNMPCPLILPET